VRRGDLYWIEFPAADGHEQRGRRPAVIIQDEFYAAQLPVVLAVPLTTASAAMRFPGVVPLQPTPQNGLRQPSVALVFQTRAIDRRRIGDQIGSLSDEELGQIFTALDKLLGRTLP
jgi:mRNA interferase MazF